MPSIDRGLNRIFDEEMAFARVPDGVLGLVTQRVTRRRAGRLVGATVVALTVAGLAATSAISLGRDAAPAVPPAAPPDVVLGSVTVPFDPMPVDGPWSGAVDADDRIPGVECGAPAPQVSTSQDGVTWDVAKRADDSWVQPIYTNLRNTHGERLPASVSRMGFVVVQDGLVVGWVSPTLQGSTSSYQFLDGEGVEIVDSFMGWGTVCGSDGTTYGDFPAGTYDIYPVISVSASPEDAARAYLQFKGYDVPVDDPVGLAAFAPGSWDCSPGGWAHARETGKPLVGGRSSVLCAEDLPNVTVDRAAGTVTLPYTSRFFAGSVGATLVGPSSSYTLPNPDVTSEGFDVWLPDPITEPAALTCGTFVGSNLVSNWPKASTTVEAVAIDPAARDSLASGASAQLALLPSVTSPPGLVSYPDGLAVWLVAHPDAESTAASQAPPGAISFGSYVVVGTATATIGSGTSISVDRYAGVSRSSLSLADVVWCGDGEPPKLTDIVVSGAEHFDSGDIRSITHILDVWSLRTDAWSAIGGGR